MDEIFGAYNGFVEVRLISEKGYAFVEYDNEKDMRYAYKQGGNIGRGSR